MKNAYSLGERILAMMLVCIMVIGMVPVNVFAANGFTPALSISTGAGEIIAGNPVEVTVNLADRGGLVDQNVTGNIEIKPNPENPAAQTAEIEYWDFLSAQWVNVSRFKTEHVAMDSYKFRVTFKTAGRYDVTVSLQPKTGSAENVVANTANLDVLESVKVFAAPAKNGTIKLDGKENTPLFLKKGENTVSVQVTPKKGFEIKSVTVGSEAQSIVNKQSFEANFSNLTKDTEVTAEFKAMQYTIQVADGLQNGIVTPNKEIIKYGKPEDVRVDVVPADGYEVDKITLNDSLDPVKVLTDEDGQFFTIPMVSEDYVIHASFKLKKYDVTVTSDGNGAGEWKLDPLSPVEHGTDAVLTITPDRNSFLHKVMIDGEETAFSEQNAESGSHQVAIRNVQKAKDVVITFKQKPQWKPAPEFTEQVKTAFADRVYNPQDNTIDLSVVSDGTITYSLANQNPANVASLEGNKLTILRAGSVTVVATRQGDATHKDTSTELELVVGLGAQKVLFSQAPSQKLIYGAQNAYTIPVVPAEENPGSAYKFSVPADNELGVSIDPATGELSGFNDAQKTGTVVVTVSRPTDDCYEAAKDAKFTVKVNFEKKADCVITDSFGQPLVPNETGWYTESVYVKAPDGYEISTSAALENNTWNDSIEVTDGKGPVNVYLKKIGGGITDVISLPVQQDTVPPVVGIEFVGASAISPVSNLFHSIFGSNQTVTVKFTASDVTSGLQSVEYSTDDGHTWTQILPEMGQSGVYQKKISAQFRDTVKIRAKDAADIVTTGDGEGGILVVDSLAPELKLEHGKCVENGGIMYPEDVDHPFEVTFIITDDNYDLHERAPIISLDGKILYDAQWTESATGASVKLTIPADEGMHNIAIDVDDGINTAHFAKKIYMAKDEPAITYTYKNPASANVGGQDYFRSNAVLSVQVKETPLTFNVWGVEIAARKNDAEYQIKTPLIGKWKYNNGIWSTDIELSEDGKYSLTLDYERFSGRKAPQTTGTFVVDKTKPVIEDITYTSPSWFEVMINSIFGTVGFSKDQVEVAVKASDATSGVKEISYCLDGSGTFTPAENGKFHIDPEYRNRVQVKVTDTAGWVTTKTDKKTVVIDTIAPDVSITYDETTCQKKGNDLYTDVKGFQLTFIVKDANFDLHGEDGLPEVKLDNKVIPANQLTWTPTAEGGVNGGKATLTLPEKAGGYLVTIDYTDRLNAPQHAEQRVFVQTDEPSAVMVHNDTPSNTLQGNNFYQQDQTVTIHVTDPTFDTSKVTFTAQNRAGAMELSLDPAGWTRIGNVSSYELPVFSTDDVYTLHVSYTDMFGRVTEYTDQFTVDKTAPVVSEVTYETPTWFDKIINGVNSHFGISKDNVKVNVTVTEDIGMESLTYQLEKDGAVFTANADSVNHYSFTVDKAYRNHIILQAKDNAQRVTAWEDSKILVIDKDDPAFEVTYAEGSCGERGNILYTAEKNFQLFFHVKEENFDLRGADPEITVNEAARALTWDDQGNAVLTLEDPADDTTYIVKATFTDRSGRVAGQYTKEVYVSRHAPSISTDCDAVESDTVGSRHYFKDPLTLTLKITDPNFEANNVKLTVMKDGRELKNIANGIAWQTENGAGSCVLPVFNQDGHYTLTAEYANLSGLPAQKYVYEYTVDQVAPAKPVITYKGQLLNKVIETLTFGYFQSPVDIVITAEDSTSGIKSITYGYTGKTGEYSTQTVEMDKISDKASVSFRMPDAFKGTLDASALDYSHNDSGVQNLISNEKGKGTIGAIVVDSITPKMDIAYTHAENVSVHKVEPDNGDTITRQDVLQADENTRFVYGGTVTAVLTVREENFDAADVKITVKKGAQVLSTYDSTEWIQTPGKAEFVKKITFSDDGDYTVEVEYTDKSINDMDWNSDEYQKTGTKKYTSNVFTVDATAPVIDVAFNPVSPANEKYYSANRTATIKITDRNFRPNEVVLTIEATDIEGRTVKYTGSDLKQWSDWKKDPAAAHTWVATVPFETDARYDVVNIDYKDIPAHAAKQYVVAPFVLDKVIPEVNATYGVSIADAILEKLTFGFYKAPTTVTFSAKDFTSEIECFRVKVTPDGEQSSNTVDLPRNLVIGADGKVISGNPGFIKDISANTNKGKTEISFKVPDQFRGKFSFTAADMAHLENSYPKSSEKAPVVVVDTINPKLSVSYTGKLQDKVTADTADSITRTTVTTADGNTRFVYSGDVTVTLRMVEANFLDKDKDVKIIVTRDGAPYESYTASKWIGDSQKDDTYTKTLTFHEDGDYQLEVTYTDKSTNDMDWTSDEYNQTGKKTYKSNLFTVDTVAPEMVVKYEGGKATDEIYYKDDRTLVVSITDRNFRPDEVAFVLDSKNVANEKIPYEYSKLTAWSDWTQDGDTWTARVPITTDAGYTLDLMYEDIAGNPVKSAFHDTFILDREAPVSAELTYSESLLTKLTFGYYKDSVQVTLKATDAISGVHSFKLNVAAEGPAGATNVTLPENLVIGANGEVLDGSKGSIRNIASNAQIGAKDVIITFEIPAQFRGLLSFDTSDMAHNTTEKIVNDTVVVVDNIAPTRTVTMEPTRILNMAMENVDSFQEDTGAVLYFNQDAVLKFQVNEANFYQEDIAVQVNGEPAAIEPWQNTKDDLWETTLTLSNDGDYVVTVEYTDRSTNQMVSYESQRIVVDKTAPVVNVAYANKNVKNTFSGRDYYDAVQTATVTIQEHNFRAQDVVIAVSAKDVTGADVLTLNSDGTVASFAQQGVSQQSWSAFEQGTWRRQDDTYVLTLTFDADANYTLDVSYEDLASNQAADYEEYAFTVDKTAPVNLSVTYSTGVLNQVLESVTFGYYNVPVKVTITAEDITTGVEYFMYSALNAAGVSGVNAQIIDAAIRAAEISYDGAKATAVFTIPQSALTNVTQFNGTLQFTAHDRSENSTELVDSKRLVVDNITPTAQIHYNSPVKEANEISYYSGNINGTIVINEANFHSGDVQVIVTKDGAAFPVNVAWHDNSTDVHTGSFTLTQEGDYTVAVKYRDKSGNAMADYLSNQMTIDTTIPSIKVSNIKNNSANKDDVYSFVITVDDVNLDTSTMKPVLSAVVKGEDGRFTTKEISLGNPITISQGKTYRYSVENLTLDAMYSLGCSVKDMSGNTISQILLDDGEKLENVQFSVNREGSAFGFGDEFTEKLVNQYYVYSVDQNVEILEVNVDPIQHYSITLNGKELKEGTDYTTAQTSEEGQWSKRTYSINKNLFVAEGEYNIIVSSTDKTNSTAYSDVKNLKIGFVVDQTKPVVTITGLESGGRYQTELQTVTLIPSDEGGRLYSLQVLLFGSNGKPRTDDTGKDISVRFDMSGEEFQKYLEEHDGVVTFTIPEGLENSVQIICNDCAVNAEGQTNEYNEIFEKVTVSQSGMIMFYANKPLLYSTIGILALVIFLIIFLVAKKKKDQKDKK